CSSDLPAILSRFVGTLISTPFVWLYCRHLNRFEKLGRIEMRMIRRCATMVGMTTALAARAWADFSPIALASGSFNHDVVVENSAPSPVIAGGYTSASMDNGIGNTAYSWYERG